MKFKEWINNLMSEGLLCCDYTSRVNSALSKKQIADIGLDANGISYIARMAQKGYPLPYETLLLEFKNFINGKYIFESEPNERGSFYTTEMYVCYSDKIDVRTTAVALLGCKATVNLNEYAVVYLHIDSNSNIIINCPSTAMCRVYRYGSANVEVSDGCGSVKFIDVSDDDEV